MTRNHCKTAGLAAAALLLAQAPVFADVYTVGYVSYDIVGTDTAAFDIFNGTGPNSLPPDFPVLSSVNLSNLSLTIDFSDGSSVMEPSTYFTLAADGLSWNGSDIGIGGVNPVPVEAMLTGTFSPTSIDVSGVGTVDILSTFSATILPSSPPNLSDGDLALIEATSAGSSVPEPGFWLPLAIIGLFLGFSRRSHFRALLRARTGGVAAALLLALSLATVPVQAATVTTVRLAPVTTPSTGVAGVNNVNVTASGWPSGDTAAANIMVSWETSCGGTPVATNVANSIGTIIGSTKRVNVSIPASLTTGNYYIQLSDSTAGDTAFTSGTTCSLVQVTGTSRTLSSCVPASSLGVVAPVTGPAPVFAIAPNASWSYGTPGAQVVQLETGGGPTVAPVSLALPDYINSCAGNPATGDAVCVANNTHVYHIRGVGTTNTFTSLTDSADTTMNFSGGHPYTGGVAVNAAGNYAVLTIGDSAAPSGSALQTLNLATDTFLPPFPLANEVSENISIDPNRGAVLSANEESNYDLVALDPSGGLTAEYTKNIGIGELDSSAEDCSTGIALAPAEFTNQFVLADLTQATFTPGTPGSWSAPTSTPTILGIYSAGLSGSAVAPGGQHLAVVTGEFNGSSFAILKLPATSGSGTPTLQDYAYVCGVANFEAGYDPHTLTAYVSPNNGKSYALFANWLPNYYYGPGSLLQADMAGILALPRGPDGHTVLGDNGSCVLDPNGTVGSTVLKSIATH
ncbi:MAG TPA: hypothetical protein VKV17_01240 [Bryobacteraceae bacterium]|nr:hypothetical protein [Bryobacteraceae bacterium]